MLQKFLSNITGIKRDELKPALLSCAYFFFVLCGYYILRPLREEMGIAGGVRDLPQLYLINLIVMLLVAPIFGWLASKTSRRVFIPATYRFFMFNMLIFFVLLKTLPESMEIQLGRVFYVWISVYNMWAVSLFWALMADGHGLDRGKRVFGFIATGGSLGAIAGAAITANLVDVIGRANLIPVSMVLLQLAVVCVNQLTNIFDLGVKPTETTRTVDRGNAWSGIVATFRSPYLLSISGYLMLYSLGSTFLYFQQANIVAAELVEREARAALFARIDLWVNTLTLIIQVFLAGRIIRLIGTGGALVLLPLLSVVGFLILGKAPVLIVLVIFQVVRRAGNYSLMRPARETLFTILPRDQKYKAKSFIDTFVYRGGDVLGASFFDVLTRAGLGLAGIAYTAVPFAIIWGLLGITLGRKQSRLAASTDNQGANP
jgi:ATP:ADP antiporter, AAA family